MVALTLTHTFVSSIPDDPGAAAAGEVLPQSHWNATHTINLGSVSANAVLFGALNGSGNLTYTEGAAAGTLNIFQVQTDSTNGHTAEIQINTGLANSVIQFGVFNSAGSASGFFNTSLALMQFQSGGTNFITFNSSSTILQLGTGTQTIQFGSSSTFTANGTTATALTSLGPAGASTTVQEWLTIQDNSGTTRYIPCF